MAPSSPSSEHARLARAFGITPTRYKVPAVASGGFGLIGLAASGVFLIPAAAIALGYGLVPVRDRRVVARRLREVETWGFPVEGYRAWLLADEPTFELELRQDIAIEVIEDSAKAIDPSIVVERRSEGVVRVVMRRIDLPANEDQVAMKIGDRRLLLELRDRILAPLHADVGIVAMRMGERATMSAHVRTQQLASASDELGGAFRNQAMVAPPALQALMRVGTAQLRPASDARASDKREHRLMYATGRTPKGPGTVLALTVAGAMSGVGLGGIGALLGLGGGLIAGLYSTIGRNKAHLTTMLAAPSHHGFPVEGYDDWLISGRPIFDIELRGPTDRLWLEARLQIKAYSVSAQTHVDWVERVTWISDTLVRIETRPMLVETSSRAVPAFYGGSYLLFEQLVRTVLVELHDRVGIVAIRMGGYVDRRA